ncbi:MAG: hypothetical protein KDD40_05005 [Bdellovibrionales bacterium]|nr:hypothetical protein [Bdellovibrionales bacterium]
MFKWKLYFGICLLFCGSTVYANNLDEIYAKANFDPTLEANLLLKDYSVVVMNENKQNIIVALCSQMAEEANSIKLAAVKSKSLAKCPVIFYGNYEGLCHARKIQRHMETVAKTVGPAIAFNAVGLSAVIAETIGPASYLLTARTVVVQAQDQYALWKESCFRDELNQSEDEMIHLLWESTLSESLEPVIYSEVDAKKFLPRFFNLAFSKPPKLKNTRSYLTRKVNNINSVITFGIHLNDWYTPKLEVN